MSTHRVNFEAWYKKVLELLYPDRDAGFAILLITFPLLERYLRQKVGLTSKDELKPPFFDELQRLLPCLGGRATARSFWQIYRHGLLHEVTLSGQARNGRLMPTGWLSHDKPLVTIESDGSIWINPKEFGEFVVATIESDFATYEGASPAASRLPTVKPPIVVANAATAPTVHRIVTGTNTDP